MPNELLTLAKAVLARSTRSRDSAWDKRGISTTMPSQGSVSHGTAKGLANQSDHSAVPASQAPGSGTVGHDENPGTACGTVVGHPYVRMLPALRSKCPELVETDRWQQTISDAETFLAVWGAQAHALGWTDPRVDRPTPFAGTAGREFPAIVTV